MTISKRGYCALWMETTSGRNGNDLANAVITILEQVIAEHSENITITIDACIPHNRNRIISYAMLEFMKRHP